MTSHTAVVLHVLGKIWNQRGISAVNCSYTYINTYIYKLKKKKQTSIFKQLSISWVSLSDLSLNYNFLMFNYNSSLGSSYIEKKANVLILTVIIVMHIKVEASQQMLLKCISCHHAKPQRFQTEKLKIFQHFTK